MKKIPPGAEASNILVGELEFLDRAVVAFVRLSPAVLLTGLAEVPIPTRYSWADFALCFPEHLVDSGRCNPQLCHLLSEGLGLLFNKDISQPSAHAVIDVWVYSDTCWFVST